MRQELGESIEARLRKPQRLAHVAHAGASTVAHDVRDHGGTVTPILLVDELDHLLASLMHDVEIDIRRLRSVFREEPLEEQPHTHRIYGGDTEAVTDRRVRCRASPLAEDLVLAAVLNDLVHRQKVAAVVELLDEVELPAKLALHVFGHVSAIAPSSSFEREMRKPLRRRAPVGKSFRGITVSDLFQ